MVYKYKLLLYFHTQNKKPRNTMKNIRGEGVVGEAGYVQSHTLTDLHLCTCSPSPTSLFSLSANSAFLFVVLEGRKQVRIYSSLTNDLNILLHIFNYFYKDNEPSYFWATAFFRWCSCLFQVLTTYGPVPLIATPLIRSVVLFSFRSASAYSPPTGTQPLLEIVRIERKF